MVDNPLVWWKQAPFPTLSQLGCRDFVISSTSCPVERLFTVAGQVDSGRRTSLSPDTVTLLLKT